jgi:hypothetical protein
MRYLSFLLLFIVVGSDAQQNLYSEIHWRPDQTGSMDSEVRKIVADSAGNTYLLYANTRDFRVKDSEFLLMKRICSIGSSGEILKLDKSGNFVWGMGLNGGDFSDIACDAKGNLIVTCSGKSVPGHYLIAYLPSSTLIADDATSLLMKISPAGDLIWSQKETNVECSSGLRKLWIDAEQNIYQYVQWNAWNFRGFMEKRNKSGNKIWSTSLDNTFPYAVEVNRAGETYYSCKTFRMEKDKMKYPNEPDKQEMWKLDGDGKKSVVFSQKCPKSHEIEKWLSIEGDYFVNQIAFNSDNSPVFYTSILMEHNCDYIVIMGRKYEERNGSFVFAEIGVNGKMLTELQLQTSAEIFERDYLTSDDVGFSKRHGAVYCGNRKWIFGIPVSEVQSEFVSGWTYYGVPLAYVNYNANLHVMTVSKSEVMYIENYKGIRFSYLPDSTLLTYGKRKDTDVPAKENHTFYWTYIERLQLKEPKVEYVQVTENPPVEMPMVNLNPVLAVEPDSTRETKAVESYPSLLYPNPTNANSLFQFVMPETTVEGAQANFTVLDGQGKILESRVITVTAGENKVEVVSAGFAMGTYTVSVTSGEMEFRMVLMKI